VARKRWSSATARAEAGPAQSRTCTHSWRISRPRSGRAESGGSAAPSFRPTRRQLRGHGHRASPGSPVNVAPPDTDGDIGPNHSSSRVVNSSTTIFNRTGGIVLGPCHHQGRSGMGFAGQCANTNNGDGHGCRYDRIAGSLESSPSCRFRQPSAPVRTFQCIAVLDDGPTPTGDVTTAISSSTPASTTTQEGRVGRTATTTTYNNLQQRRHVRRWAWSAPSIAPKMLVRPARATPSSCFNVGPRASAAACLASDLDGPTLPPAGSPNFVLGARHQTPLDFFQDARRLHHARAKLDAHGAPRSSPTAALQPAMQTAAPAWCRPGTTPAASTRSPDRLMKPPRVPQLHGSRSAAGVALGHRGHRRRASGFLRAAQPGDPRRRSSSRAPFAPDLGVPLGMSSMAFDGSGQHGDWDLRPRAQRSTRAFSLQPAGSPPIPSERWGQGEGTIVAGPPGSQIGNLSRWG